MNLDITHNLIDDVAHEMDVCRSSADEWRQLADRAHEAARSDFLDRPYTGTIRDPKAEPGELHVCPVPDGDLAAARHAAADLARLAYAVAGHYGRERDRLHSQYTRLTARTPRTRQRPDPLADIAAALDDQPRTLTRDVLDRLTAAHPHVYRQWTLRDLTAYLTRHDAAPRKSNGRMVIDTTRIHATLAARHQEDAA